MAQLVSILFFALVAFGTLTLIAAMLAAETARVRAILSGQELQIARAHRPRVKIRLQMGDLTEARRSLPRLSAAAA